MTEFSANLGFLWLDLPLPEAIRAAKTAGFDAVECHWPFEFPADAVKSALDETGLEMLSLNTWPGNRDQGENGLSALPDRVAEGREAIDQAIGYAAQIKAAKVHVMAGFATGEEAHRTYISNLIYAAEMAEPHGIELLIEPLNRYDAPGYFLETPEQAVKVIEETGLPCLSMIFDCYHVQLMGGDLSNRLKSCMPKIGHIQFASVPDRGTPDRGEVNYAHLFEVISALGYSAPLGAEYKPRGETGESLQWLKMFS